MGLHALNNVESPVIDVEAYPEWVAEVDYTRDFDEMLVGAGYQSVHERVIRHQFPLVGNGLVRFAFCVYWFGGYNSSAEARQMITEDTRSWQPGTIEFKFAVLEKFPNLIERFPIAACGSPAQMGTDFVDIPVSRLEGPRKLRALSPVWDQQRHRNSNRHEGLDTFRYLGVRVLP